MTSKRNVWRGVPVWKRQIKPCYMCGVDCRAVQRATPMCNACDALLAIRDGRPS